MHGTGFCRVILMFNFFDVGGASCACHVLALCFSCLPRAVILRHTHGPRNPYLRCSYNLSACQYFLRARRRKCACKFSVYGLAAWSIGSKFLACYVRATYLSLAICQIFARRLPVGGRTAGCKSGIKFHPLASCFSYVPRTCFLHDLILNIK